MSQHPRRIAILGAGGLGRNAARYLDHKQEFSLVALADSEGVAHRSEGIDGAILAALPEGASIAQLAGIGRTSADPVAEIIRLNAEGHIDAVLLTVPNIPNSFIPELIARFCREGFDGVIVDAIKRTSAVQQILAQESAIAASKVTYVTGAGATPGLLTAAAALAAQSFVSIDEVKIWFGVGMANWDKYRATIREDIAHMPGFSVEKVRVMSDAEVESLLDECNGLMELHNMEHADDILLERAGVVEAAKVSVGGLVDTRNEKKPTSTTMFLTGKTFEGKTATHRFILGDDASMAANVLGPAFGWMNAALSLHDRGVRGLFSSADLMPKYVR